ncbi:MAG: SNF2 helicase associated domain-containing protein [Simkaniaceae bacterium]|nr:MAG: SNF2 helicase associated domain-containing protein [Simkaniaceae bacterium]
MLNLRKLKQDFSSAILKEGKDLFETKKVLSAKILHLDATTIRISARVLGQYNNTYESEIEIDRMDSETIDSDCNCPYHYDCQHLAAVLFHLESCLDEILVKFSKETDIEEVTEDDSFCHEEKEKLLEAVKEAETKEAERKDEEYQKELLKEYIGASSLLAKSPFFLPAQQREIEKAELAVIFHFSKKGGSNVDVQLALRLPSRSKPLHIPNVRQFLEAVRYREPLYVGGKSHLFSLESFQESEQEIARLVMDHAKLPEKVTNERAQKMASLDMKIFGMIMAKAEEIASKMLKQKGWTYQDDELPTLPCLFEENLESPIHFSKSHANVNVTLEYIHPPTSKILLNPMLLVDQQKIVLEDARFFECAKPGIIYNHVYYRFSERITRQHLRSLMPMRDMTIPEPLFGTFVENALPEMSLFAEVDMAGVVEHFTTLPFVGSIEAICDLTFLNGELDAALSFRYDTHTVPASSKKLGFADIDSFVTEEGIVARNLVEEQKIIEDLFQDFIFDLDQQVWAAKTEKKIIEFMTDVIPRNQHRVKFNYPQNLLDQFIYDQSKFKLTLSHTDRMDVYEMNIDVKGALKGVTVDRLWDCIVSRRAYLELDMGQKKTAKAKESGNKIPKILVLDLEEVGAVVQLFDELGIEKLDNKKLERPLWSLANIDESNFKDLPVTFTMTPQLKEIRKQMLGEKVLKFSPIPKQVDATLRHYQEEGVQWLERLRTMFLNGILADDMGLGKTLQAICALTQHKGKANTPALVVCPTSLLYNWKEECHKFNNELKTLIVDGMPNQRKKLIKNVKNYDVVITSYSLLQKDIEAYDKVTFSYMILDEAQHIKNRGTRNAKSVKLVKAQHRVILSGTPIENSLDELWSLFDYLMPGFLGSYERFVEKYVRLSGEEQTKNLQYLRKKVAPFILRRMKVDVLDDLPPVSENVYHCQLTNVQKELYKSYAESARDELMKLVERDGFDKVQIHVLATLTRLKQICCHPAIFAKEKAEAGDSAKYEMLLELLQTLIEGQHKTVIFSQYTRMLQIMRTDFEQRGIRFNYLDGSSKNRLDIVNEFNNDPNIPVFLVSLKAGGTGLNLVGADTVIHYDMWWNPAVENQATDRVHRIGQKESVSVYKLVTMGTIEEKIVEMQNRKKGIVKKIVSCDDEAITKLTWEDVLELLQT